MSKHSTSLFATKAISSEKSNTDLVSLPILTPRPLSFTFFTIPLMKILKSKGDNVSPCLTPTFDSNQSESTSFTHTLTVTFLYHLFTRINSFPGTPSSTILLNKPSLHTLSYAFFKSTKHRYVFFWTSNLFKTSRASVYPWSTQPQPFLKPACSSTIPPS